MFFSPDPDLNDSDTLDEVEDTMAECKAQHTCENQTVRTVKQLYNRAFPHIVFPSAARAARKRNDRFLALTLLIALFTLFPFSTFGYDSQPLAVCQFAVGTMWTALTVLIAWFVAFHPRWQQRALPSANAIQSAIMPVMRCIAAYSGAYVLPRAAKSRFYAKRLDQRQLEFLRNLERRIISERSRRADNSCANKVWRVLCCIKTPSAAGAEIDTWLEQWELRCLTGSTQSGHETIVSAQSAQEAVVAIESRWLHINAMDTSEMV